MNNNNILEEYGKRQPRIPRQPAKGEVFNQWDGTVQKFNGVAWEIVTPSNIPKSVKNITFSTRLHKLLCTLGLHSFTQYRFLSGEGISGIKKVRSCGTCEIHTYHSLNQEL